MEKTIRVICKQGGGRYVTIEVKVDMTQSNPKVSRIEDRVYIDFATPEGGVGVDLPWSSANKIKEALNLIANRDKENK